MILSLSLKRSYIIPKLAKYWAIARVNYHNNLAYIVNVFGRSLTVVLRIWIFTQLYTVTYQVTGNSEIGGLTVPMTIWCLMLTQSFQSATRPPVVRLIEEEVKSGNLAYSIVRPFSYVLFHFFGFLGRCGSNLLFNLFIGSLAAIILVGLIKTSLTGLIFCLFLLSFGLMIDFLISFLLGLAAFWLEDVSALYWIYSKAQMVFGGILLPISLFPEYLKKIAEILPFSQLYYSAARIFVSPDWYLFGYYLVIQLAWLVFLLICTCFLFNKALRNVSINGG